MRFVLAALALGSILPTAARFVGQGVAYRQLTAIHRPDGASVTFGYDGAGHLATVTQPRGTGTLSYHAGAPVNDTVWAERVLQTIVGRELSSVEFVRDYCQLRFDGPTLTAVTQPVVENKEREYRWGQSGFRDEVCERIGRKVAPLTIP